MKRLPILLILTLAACTAKAPAPYGPTPSASQLEWQKMEYNMFVHFGPNTFSGLEWGQGSEPEDIFNPTDLDCWQWAAIAKEAGMKGIILTAKHHDGFCLWPNPESAHTVAKSSWRDGNGDVLAELSAACREYGLKFGVYISPWDRHDPAYGTLEYNDKFIRTLQDVHGGRYGEIFEQWFDGACGEGPTGKRQVYNWEAFNRTVFELSPNAVIFSDVGPGCRWVGNEKGIACETNWSPLDVEGFTPGAGAPPIDTLQQGNVHGALWVPAETDVSIRPGWFWHAEENEAVKSVEHLENIWISSVGRNSLLLLNVPPDTRGRIHEADSLRLMEFRARREEIFGTDLSEGASVKADACRGRKFRAENILNGDYDSFWTVPDGCLQTSFVVELPEERSFDLVMLQEYIPLGQRVSSFRIEAETGGAWQLLAEGSTIGYKRMVRVPLTSTQRVRVSICGAKACPVLNKFALFKL